MQNNKSYIIPLSLIGLFFFAIGFAFGINGFLTPVLKGSLTNISTFQANLLIVVNFIPFLIFSYPAALCIKAIGYKRTMAVSFILFAIAFGLFVPATSMQSIWFFLVACFISGIANTILQAAVNPYITILGPIESAAQRMSIMGICNKLAWPTTTVFMLLVIGKTDVAEIQLGELYNPFYIIIGIFIALAVISLLAPLPEVSAEGETEAPPTSPQGEDNHPDDSSLPHVGESEGVSYAQGKTSIWQFPHLVFGAVVLFLYVGVETITLSTITDYTTSLGLTELPKWVLYISSLGMCAGYIVGATMIPRFISQVLAMRICAVMALAGSIAICLLPGMWSVYCLFFMGLGCSLMWPALWPMAMADLGPFTKNGAALLTTAIAGGAAMPAVRAWVEGLSCYQTSYWVCVPCFLVIAWYGFFGYKVR